MSGFVLKIAPWNSEQVTWMPGVKRVKRIESLPARDVIDSWRNYEPDWECAADFGPDDSFLMTLLFVETANYGGFLAVNQAWLVGPGGGTVDRLHGTGSIR